MLSSSLTKHVAFVSPPISIHFPSSKVQIEMFYTELDSKSLLPKLCNLVVVAPYSCLSLHSDHISLIQVEMLDEFSSIPY
ncbi:unnamed protein product [Lactuca virosa]|uniref:Uncharacterized protein n=1 Tax=Lactuca virosa TaxID=75947 RepID=A0AAU9LL90_9ASTR|nr:unnamed protein product [Lactuca virosa]